jgi:hypothetical protein
MPRPAIFTGRLYPTGLWIHLLVLRKTLFFSGVRQAFFTLWTHKQGKKNGGMKLGGPYTVVRQCCEERLFSQAQDLRSGRVRHKWTFSPNVPLVSSRFPSAVYFGSSDKFPYALNPESEEPGDLRRPIRSFCTQEREDLLAAMFLSLSRSSSICSRA